MITRQLILFALLAMMWVTMGCETDPIPTTSSAASATMVNSPRNAGAAPMHAGPAPRSRRAGS